MPIPNQNNNIDKLSYSNKIGEYKYKLIIRKTTKLLC